MHIFFNAHTLGIEVKQELLADAYELATKWWVDKLDCSESWSRQKINMPFDEIKGYLTESCHITVIHRVPAIPIQIEHGEIGFSNMGRGINYYLWIDLKTSDLYDIVEKYNLPKMTL